MRWLDAAPGRPLTPGSDVRRSPRWEPDVPTCLSLILRRATPVIARSGRRLVPRHDVARMWTCNSRDEQRARAASARGVRRHDGRGGDRRRWADRPPACGRPRGGGRPVHGARASRGRVEPDARVQRPRAYARAARRARSRRRAARDRDDRRPAARDRRLRARPRVAAEPLPVHADHAAVPRRAAARAARPRARCARRRGRGATLQDAANLGWKLAAVAHRRAPAGRLDSYHAERRPVGRSTVRASATMLRLALARSPVVRATRGPVARAVTRIPALNRRVNGFVSGITIVAWSAGDATCGQPSRAGAGRPAGSPERIRNREASPPGRA
jgi:hypothetical protein